jgi:hypothetical protein
MGVMGSALSQDCVVVNFRQRTSWTFGGAKGISQQVNQPRSDKRYSKYFRLKLHPARKVIRMAVRTRYTQATSD